MGSLFPIFIISLTLWFGVTSLVTGIFAAYFGAGKSRSIGTILMLIGLFCVAFVVATQFLEFGVLTEVWLWEHLLGILGAAVGGIVGLLLFLFCIMKA